MEKYSRWRDEGTGIHPFLPKSSSDENSLWYIRLTFGSLFAIIKFPFLLIFVFLLFVFSSISFLIPIAPIQRLILRITHIFTIRPILFFLGFYWISTKHMKPFHPKFRFSPIFASSPVNWNGYPKDVPFKPRNLFQKIYDVVNEPQNFVQGTMNLSELVHYAKSRKSPVVIFPEGVTTNGKALLYCLPVLEGIVSQLSVNQVRVIGFKYEFTHFSPRYIVGSFFLHLFYLITQFSNSMEVRYLLPLELTTLREEKGDEEFQETVFTALASILRVQRAKLNAQDKQDFKAYWYGHKKAYKKDK